MRKVKVYISLANLVYSLDKQIRELNLQQEYLDTSKTKDTIEIGLGKVFRAHNEYMKRQKQKVL